MCWLKQSCLKDLLSQKLLIEELVANLYFIALLEFHNLNSQVVCKAAELVLLPKQKL